MHAVNLLASALRYEQTEVMAWPDKLVLAVCAVTGQTAPCWPRESVLGASFTNLDLLKAPESSHISDDARIALSCKWERMSSWICDGIKFTRLDRQGIRALVIGGAYPKTWAAYATTSYKKHGSLWAPVNTGKMAVWRFEGLSVDCSDHDRLLDWWHTLLHAHAAGISRPVMETLIPIRFTYATAGIEAWLRFLAWAKSKYRNPLYQFLCYLLPSREEMKDGAQDGAKPD